MMEYQTITHKPFRLSLIPNLDVDETRTATKASYGKHEDGTCPTMQKLCFAKDEIG